MNFLAHLYLGDGTPERLVGNFLGDFCKGSVDKHDPTYREGIVQHRAVDAFTDRHQLVTRNRRMLTGRLGHYAAVAYDVVMDHFLARNWSRYSEEPLADSAGRYYAILNAHRREMPADAAWVVKIMSEQDWLTGYRTIEGLRSTLERMSRRLRRPVRLADAVELVEESRVSMEQDFLIFFDELRERMIVPHPPSQ